VDHGYYHLLGVYSLDSLQCLGLRSEISIIDGAEILPLPEWTAALVWLGAWCRKHQLMDKRLITFAVLPTRDLAAAFACLGSLLAGAEAFEDTLSWSKFSCLPRGTKVFWSTRDGSRSYQGNIIGLEFLHDSEFIVVCVMKAARRAEIGSTFRISQKYFDNYRFTEEQPPTVSKTCSFGNASRFACDLLERVNPNWIWADGAEGILITSMAKFDKAITGLSLKAGGQQSLPLRDLLCIEINGKTTHAKLRVTHPRGKLSGNFPLAILDGPDAFLTHEYLHNIPNILVILDRNEYRESIHGSLLQLMSIAVNTNENYFEDLPDKFPHGIELAAYTIDRS
jgi:hypothetical protein